MIEMTDEERRLSNALKDALEKISLHRKQLIAADAEAAVAQRALQNYLLTQLGLTKGEPLIICDPFYTRTSIRHNWHSLFFSGQDVYLESVKRNDEGEIRFRINAKPEGTSSSVGDVTLEELHIMRAAYRDEKGTP